MKIKDLLLKTKQEFKTLGLQTPDLDAELLVAKALGKARLEILINLDCELSKAQLSRALNLIELRKQYMPIAYITHEKDFWKHTFYVDNRVLIPRPESEAFLELTLKYFTDKNAELKILDLGSGSGCLGISVLSEYQNA
ncbi:MAG: N5-glutamine methyltransferase family protein, partial [Alphaproteobacteria bacterium]